MPFATRFINYPCAETLRRVRRSLRRTGLRVMETFDLQAARLRSADCPCPEHGTQACDCQMVVLMVYGRAAAPGTLILHGNNGRTWISLVEDAALGTDALIAAAVREAVGEIGARQGL